MCQLAQVAGLEASISEMREQLDKANAEGEAKDKARPSLLLALAPSHSRRTICCRWNAEEFLVATMSLSSAMCHLRTARLHHSTCLPSRSNLPHGVRLTEIGVLDCAGVHGAAAQVSRCGLPPGRIPIESRFACWSLIPRFVGRAQARLNSNAPVPFARCLGFAGWSSRVRWLMTGSTRGASQAAAGQGPSPTRCCRLCFASATQLYHLGSFSRLLPRV